LYRADPQVETVASAECFEIEDKTPLRHEQFVEPSVQPEQQKQTSQHPSPQEPATALPPRRSFACEEQISEEDGEGDGSRKIQVHRHLPSDESLAEMAEDALSDWHDDAGVKRESTLPEEQDGENQKTAEEEHKIRALSRDRQGAVLPTAP
jgi:hypothetical protein